MSAIVDCPVASAPGDRDRRSAEVSGPDPSNELGRGRTRRCSDSAGAGGECEGEGWRYEAPAGTVGHGFTS